MQNAQNFWEWFQNNEEKYRNMNELSTEFLLKKLLSELEKVNEHFIFELSSEAVNGKFQFVVSADGLFPIFPLILRFVEAAPALEHWNIIAFRPRTGEMSISSHNLSLQPQDIFFDYSPTPSFQLDLTVYIKDLSESTEEKQDLVFLLMDYLVGEYDVATKFGMITFQTLPVPLPSTLLSLTHLPQVVDQFTESQLIPLLLPVKEKIIHFLTPIMNQVTSLEFPFLRKRGILGDISESMFWDLQKEYGTLTPPPDAAYELMLISRLPEANTYGVDLQLWAEDFPIDLVLQFEVTVLPSGEIQAVMQDIVYF